MDWNYFKYIEAIAVSGTLSEAAKVLKIDQSTLTRNLQRLERDTGTKIFRKQGKGYVPTLEGTDIVRKAKEMKALEAACALGKSGRRRVAVTSLDSFLTKYLLKAPLDFDFDLEFIESNRRLDLSRREADIAIRFTKPEKGDYVIRELCKIGHAIYARKNETYYEELAKNRWAALNDDFHRIEDTQWLRRSIEGFSPSFRTTSYHQIVGLIENGRCLGVLPCYWGDDREDFTRFHSGKPLFQKSVWLVIHRESIYQPEIKTFKEWLLNRVKTDKAILTGER